jgi:hypothetical protein
MPAAKTVHLDVHAIATLRYIRASMDAASSVAIPGSAGIIVGTIGCVATMLSLLPPLQSYWISIWLAAAPVAASIGGVLLARPSSIASFTAHGTPGRKLALGLFPCLFAGAVITVILSTDDRTTFIPGIWLLLYGCALISASVSTMTIVAWMGLSFTVLGITALCSPAVFHIPLLGIGFGGLHILFGILIARGIHGRES